MASSPFPDVKPQLVHHLSVDPAPDDLHGPEKKPGVKQRCVKLLLVSLVCFLLLLLVTLVLLSYYLSSACVGGRPCGDGSCVLDSQWCDGVSQCSTGLDEAQCVRFRGSGSQLQVFWTQTRTWRSVCSLRWSQLQGRSSCRDVGFGWNTYYSSGQEVAADEGHGFLTLKSNVDHEAPIMQQLVPSDTCVNNSVVTLHCTDCSRSPLGSWQVSLQVGGSHRCGGAIVSPSWIVTSAHCVDSFSDPGQWLVYAGMLDPLDVLFSPAHAVDLIVKHGGFVHQTRQNDVALLRLLSPLDASRQFGPVCLPNTGLNVSNLQNIWTSGFNGSADSEAQVSLMEAQVSLVEAQVSLVDVDACNDSYSGRISEDMICTRAEHGSNTCARGGGRPLAASLGGVWWLLGNNIWDQSCSHSSKPDVYGNATNFLDWIFRQMKVNVKVAT